MRLEHLLSGEDGYNKEYKKRFDSNPVLLYYSCLFIIEKDEAERSNGEA